MLEQFDTNDSAGFELEQSFAWAYDDLDRLTAETFDLGDDGSSTGDYVAVYEFDLNGNRLAKETDHDYSGAVGNMSADETIAYTYDENGRLLTETKDAAGTTGDRHTVYAYGTNYERTEQTGKTVYQGLTAGTEQDKREVVANEYDLAGRLAGVEIDRTGGGGGVTVTTFEYDDGGNRVRQVGVAASPSGDVTTTYLIDDNNLTGYSQTLEQTDRDYSDEVVKKTTYVIGPDVIGQYVTEDSTTTGAIYLQDAHGSTRGLYATTSGALLDAAKIASGGSTWTKTLTYDAYGNALGFDAASAGTELLYNGESFNSRTGQQYLRARWYSPAAGRFGQLDPWAGSIYLPLSLNPYNYCHASPVFHIDPTGRVTIREVMAIGMIASFLASMAIPMSHMNVDMKRQNFDKAFDYDPNALIPSLMQQLQLAGADVEMQYLACQEELGHAGQVKQIKLIRARNELLFAQSTDAALHAIEYAPMVLGGMEFLATGPATLLPGMGRYGSVGGHHPLSGRAFDYAKYDDALAIGQRQLNAFGQVHPQPLTAIQQRGYMAFGTTGEPLTLTRMTQIEVDAMVKAGIPEPYAKQAASDALWQRLGFGDYTAQHIPWVGPNPGVTR